MSLLEEVDRKDQDNVVLLAVDQFQKVGTLDVEKLRGLMAGRGIQDRPVQARRELVYTWDAVEVVRVISRMWGEILAVKEKLSPEDLRIYIMGIVIEYYRENKDFKNFVDALAR